MFLKSHLTFIRKSIRLLLFSSQQSRLPTCEVAAGEGASWAAYLNGGRPTTTACTLNPLPRLPRTGRQHGAVDGVRQAADDRGAGAVPAGAGTARAGGGPRRPGAPPRALQLQAGARPRLPSVPTAVGPELLVHAIALGEHHNQ